MSLQYIQLYYKQLDNLKRVGVANELAIKQPFDNLLLNIATEKHYVYATEVTIKGENGKNIRPDGIVMNELRIHKGYVESKDTNDTLNDEINKKLFKDGYPKNNILFQDSIEAVLFQNGIEVLRIPMNEEEQLNKIINQFVNYRPQYIEKFEEALEKFKEDIPTIVGALRNTIGEQYNGNQSFISTAQDFFEMCQKEINPQIAREDIREMIIQHILTEDLFKSVFDESDFHHENNIATQLENVVNTFMTRSVRQNQLGDLGYYYKTLNAQASMVADHHEKQKFLKVVYENFYKVYNPKGADKLGVVYTPNEMVRFMVQSTDYLLQKHFNKQLSDKNVHILDPATGTGTFITDIIDYIPSQYLEYKYKNEIFANEVAILPYYVANLNIEYTYKQKMGRYEEFPNSCFVDTLDNIESLKYEGKQYRTFGFSTENAERIKRQNDQKISVIIGNPPYNANQANFNDNNKNREYQEIDERIKNTYVKFSSAQKTKVYDMYARFYRWASDRISKNGILSFVTNRSFIDSRTFDGFRKIIASEFNHIYIIDLGGDIRSNPKLSGPKHNVFGIQTGVAIMILVKDQNNFNVLTTQDFETVKENYGMVEEPTVSYGNRTAFSENPCRIYYYRRPEDELAKSKLEFLNYSKIQNLVFDVIHPDKNNNWINLPNNNDWDTLIPVADKKNNNKIFNVVSNGVLTARDEWVYDFDKKNLEKKSKYLNFIYNYSLKTSSINYKIKWSEGLDNQFKRKLKSKYNKNLIITSIYRPFTKKLYYSEKFFSDRLTQKHFQYFGDNLKNKNKVIACSGPNHSKPFQSLGVDVILGLDFLEKTQCLPLYIYDKDGNQHYNITDWGLNQFVTHYQIDTISKEDIFNYIYAILHNPNYRDKYELNLKRDFPRIPFYDDFFQWADFGKQLLELHINYENVEPFPLLEINSDKKFDSNYKLKVKLVADKSNHCIEIDEKTTLSGVPDLAWEYKLGNRAAIDWVLDQYKEKKCLDKTIEEQFNTYRFEDYKTEVIELLKKIITISLKTQEILDSMNTCK